MSSNDSDQSYLIDCEHYHEAIPLKDVDEFSAFKKSSWTKRIYTVGEAIEDVKREIESIK